MKIGIKAFGSTTDKTSKLIDQYPFGQEFMGEYILDFAETFIVSNSYY
jgi:hypothetical protein